MLDYPEFHIDSTEVKEVIFKYGEKIICKKGDSIITPNSKKDENVYFVEEGFFVFLVNDEEGNNIIYKINDAGSFICLVPIFVPVSLNFTVTSLKDSIIYKLNNNTIHELMDSSKVFREYVVKDLSYNAYKNSFHSILLALKYNKEKVYIFLLMNADYENPMPEGWYRLLNQYKQQEIADYFGITRITVWKIINELCEEELLRTINNKIQVRLDLDKVLK